MKDLKKLKDVKYPADFINPKAEIVDESGVNKLIQMLTKENWCISTGDTRVILPSTGYVEVYKLVAETRHQVADGID